MKKYIIVILLVILIVTVGISRVQQNQTETQNKNKVQNKLQSVTKENVTMCATIPKPELELINPEAIKKEENNNYIVMQATAYTKSKEEGTYNGITRSGTEVSRGTVSVDPRVIPLGTKLYIEGYGHAIALDTGGDIRHNRIDLYMETKEEAFEFGRQEVKVYILDDNKNKI